LRGSERAHEKVAAELRAPFWTVDSDVIMPTKLFGKEHYAARTIRPKEFLPFKAGFATIAAATEKRLGARVPIVPSGFCYTKNNRWTARLNIGEAVYLEDFVSRQLQVSYTEQRVAELSGLFAAGQP
jgi:hypothetical protein